MPSSYSPSRCVCFSLLKQVFLTRWSLDSLQCANASEDYRALFLEQHEKTGGSQSVGFFCVCVCSCDIRAQSYMWVFFIGISSAFCTKDIFLSWDCESTAL